MTNLLKLQTCSQTKRKRESAAIYIIVDDDMYSMSTNSEFGSPILDDDNDEQEE